VLFSTLFSVLGVRYFSFLSSAEKTAADIRMAAFQAPMPQSQDMVIVAITEETLAQFPYRSPVDRAFLASLLTTLEQKGARAIGVDILFDQPTESAKDAVLKRTLRSLKTPLFISYTTTSTIVNEDQLAYLNDYVPENMRAAANLATDPFDGAVRWIFPGLTEPGMPVGFPFKAIQLLGQEPAVGQIEIAWRSRPDGETTAFPIYPAHTAEFLPDEWIQDKIVLIGAIVSLTDRHRTPLAVVHDGDEGLMPGIVVQAHAISQLLEGRVYPRLSKTGDASLTVVFAGLGAVIGLLKFGVLLSFITGFALVVAWWLGAIWGFSYGLPLVPLVAPSLALLLALWMMDALIGRVERKKRQYIQGAFSRYVSPVVVSQLAENPDALTVSGIKREATFIFTDIAGFTTLSEKLTSEKLAEVLNEYLDGACKIILRYDGTVDKFIGDAIMSIFNAPLAQSDHADRAVQCALELDAYAEDFRKRQNAAGVPLGVTRIGVHTGVATVGNFGSNSRMDYTALGDTVNTAARTEGVNKYFGTRICCTQETVSQCKSQRFKTIGDVILKGKTEPVTLYTPVTDEQAAGVLYRWYQTTYELLKNKDPDAASAVSEMHKVHPDDPLVHFHYERIQSGLITSLIVMEDK
jgi:class 3 adenylate cyclase/CHASE2 domain-containing sensor protein